MIHTDDRHHLLAPQDIGRHLVADHRDNLDKMYEELTNLGVDPFKGRNLVNWAYGYLTGAGIDFELRELTDDEVIATALHEHDHRTRDVVEDYPRADGTPFATALQARDHAEDDR